MSLIFEKSTVHGITKAQHPDLSASVFAIPASLVRKVPPRLPACSELEVIRHYTRLSQRNFAIDTHMYPLGSCTMKYNPRGIHKAASLDGFLQHHPLSTADQSQGILKILFKLQTYLSDICGMSAVCLSPMAGSQGEFAGVSMIKAYHDARGDGQRSEILIPNAAHGTNPASAAMCGYKVVELATNTDGEIDLDELHQRVGPQTAGIMLTNPSTLGLFIRQIQDIERIIHQAGGLLYYDGANLNAIIGKVRPGDMGFDVMHLNLHKTFATPHGGGGPGSGPIAVNQKLMPFLPTPYVIRDDEEYYRLAYRKDCPNTMGRLSCFMGNTGILVRAYFYIRMLGQAGIERIATYATLNANYLMTELIKIGYTVAYPGRRASHEFIITLQSEKKTYGISAMDVAKRLLDYGFHAPTTYFPLLVPECLLIEPTETESKQRLDNFISTMQKIREEMVACPEKILNAPETLSIKRLDEVKAARELNLNYYRNNNDR
jgi:glycine dehydrogenase subunit 2